MESDLIIKYEPPAPWRGNSPSNQCCRDSFHRSHYTCSVRYISCHAYDCRTHPFRSGIWASLLGGKWKLERRVREEPIGATAVPAGKSQRRCKLPRSRRHGEAEPGLVGWWMWMGMPGMMCSRVESQVYVVPVC